jgi:flagellar biosynthesis/type III secretory pathway chaperone
MSEQTINDLHIVLDNIDSRIEKSILNTEELQYLTYQKIKILQLIDDFNQRKEYFVKH